MISGAAMPADGASFEAVLAAYLVAADSGSAPSLETLVERYPEFADELVEFFQAEQEAQRAAKPWRRAARLPRADVPAVINDHELIREIARGGMGVVYEARHQSLRRRVAVKMILAGDLADPIEAQRFHTEAEAVARLKHPNIVQIYELGAHDAQPYFTMEYIDGRTLGQWTKEVRPSPVEVARVMRTIAIAIEHAHSQGVLHRDLKPSNVLMDSDNVPHVVDFGLAKAAGSSSASLTRTGAILGTPSYMSPEQARGDEALISPTSDVYSLGAILYELLTGRPPSSGSTPMEVLLDVVYRDPLRPSLLVPTVPKELETICLKCLEKLPESRYQTAGALADDLGRYLDHRPILAKPPGLVGWIWRWCRRNPLLASVTATASLLALTVAVGAVAYSIDSTRQLRRVEQARDVADLARRESEVLRQTAEQQEHEACQRAYVAETRQAYDAWMRSDFAEARQLLDRYQSGTDSEDLRHWEWKFVDHLCRTRQTVLAGHSGAVRAVAWRPDGRRLCSVSADGSARIYETQNWQEIETLRFRGEVNTAAWSPDGKLLAIGGSDGTLARWSEITKEVERSKASAMAICAVTWSPNGGRLAAAGDDATIYLWSQDNSFADPIALLGHRDSIRDLAWKPDSTQLVSTSRDGTACLWNPKETQPTLRLEWLGARGKADGVAWSPDGKRLAFATWAGSIIVADAESGEPILTTGSSDQGSIQAIRYSPDGKFLVTTGYDRLVRTWEAATGVEFLSWRGHADWGLDVAWSPDGTLIASSGKDSSVRIWQFPSEQIGMTIARDQQAIFSIDWSPDGGSYAFSGSGRVWLGRPKGPLALVDHEKFVYAAAFSPDGRLIASASDDATIQIWDVRARQRQARFQGDKPIYSLAWGPDSKRVASVSHPGEVTIWDIATSTKQRSFGKSGLEIFFTSRSESPILPRLSWNCHNRLALANGRRLGIWDPDSGRPQRIFPLVEAPVTSLAWSHSGSELATGGADGVVRLWDTKSGCQLRAFTGHSNRIESLAWSPDDRRLASAGWDKFLCIWNLDINELALCLQGQRGWIQSIAWSPDGNRILSGGWDAAVRLWETEQEDQKSKSE